MRQDVVMAARGWLGVKFHHQGRSRLAGVDCLGLLVKVAEECALMKDGQALAALDQTDYGRNPDPAYLLARLAEVLEPVAAHALEPGDVGVFRIDGRAQHLAIIGMHAVPGEFSMIHAYAPLRKVVEHRFDATWRERMAAAFRLGS